MSIGRTARTRLLGPSARLAQWLQRSQIKSIQRGTVTLNNVTSATATITSVDLSNARITMLGVQVATTSTVAAEVFCRVALTNATTVTGFVTTGEANNKVISFEVIEYYPGVIRLVQRGTIATAAASSNTATITSSDVTKSTLDFLGFVTSEAALQGTTIAGQLVLTNATTVTWTLGGSHTTTCGYQVILWF